MTRQVARRCYRWFRRSRLKSHLKGLAAPPYRLRERGVRTVPHVPCGPVMRGANVPSWPGFDRFLVKMQLPWSMCKDPRDLEKSLGSFFVLDLSCYALLYGFSGDDPLCPLRRRSTRASATPATESSDPSRPPTIHQRRRDGCTVDTAVA